MQATSQINDPNLTPITGRFHIFHGKLLGGGTYANVYKGYDSKLKKYIAVKHVKGSDYSRCRSLFQREIAVMQKLQHQYIIQFYDFELDKDDGLFIFLELCQKQNMKKKILEQLTEEETHVFFSQLVEGMAYMNSLRIFHRDLKPDNLLITKEGKLKIADFGIARQFFEQQVQYTMLRCTYYYSAPQILLGYVDYNEKCDVYSAGYVLYEMLTCQKIYQKHISEHKTLKEVLRQVKDKGGWKIDHPSLVNKPHWSNLLKRMLQFNPARRISFAQIREYLSSLKPTDKLPIFRTVSEQELYGSRKSVELIKSYVQFKTKRQNYLINVLKMFEHIQYFQSQFLPKTYKLALLYLSLARYCLLGNNLLEQLSRRDKMEILGNKVYQQVFKTLVVEDKSEITKYLDQVAIKLNKGKQEMKLFMRRHILPELKQIIIAKNKKEFHALAQMPNLLKIIESFEEKHQEQQDFAYENFLRKIIDNCFLTDEEVNCLGIMDLRTYLLLLIIKNFKKIFSQQSHLKKNMPPTFQNLLDLSKQRVIDFIRVLKDESIPMWDILAKKSKKG